MMKPWILVLAALVPAVFSATIDYGSPSPVAAPADPYGGASDGYQTQEQQMAAPSSSYEPQQQGYDQPAQTSGGYGQAQVKCTPYFDTVFSDHCESYTDRVCRSTHQEKCHDVPEKNCRAVVSGRQVRKCFNVTELICKLREDVKYEVVQVGFTVQKCHKVSERVCDTVFDTSFTTKDDFQCLNVQNPICSTGERTINDKTCTTTTQFDCPTSMGYEEPSYGGGDSYGNSGASSMSSGGDSYGSAAPSSSYGAPAPVPKCRRSQSTKCYNTPRTVTIQNCARNSEKVCEKMTEKVPYAEEKQNCHNEDKKVCELEERTQPKQVKKYVYTKQCRSVPRRVCENADSKQMVPSCVQSMRKQCTQTPVETCEDIPKKHCFKVGRKVRKEKCETVQATYPEQQQGYAANPAQQPSPAEPSYDGAQTAEGY